MKWLASILACGFVASSVGYAQSNDWNTVRALPAGTHLVIELSVRHRLHGVLQGVDDATLTIEKYPPVARADIQRIAQLGDPQIGRSAKWGFLTGAAGGVTLGYVTAQGSKGTWALLQGIGWSSVGALIGAIDGAQSRKEMVIYSSP